MEAKTIVTIFSFAGWPFSLLGIVENWGDFKAIVIFVLIVIYWIIRVAFFSIKNYQEMKKREMDLERERYELDHHKHKYDDKDNK